MIEKGQINQDSKVLDLGCGNGTTALSLHDELGCNVVGVDLSGVRIDKRQWRPEAAGRGCAGEGRLWKSISYGPSFRGWHFQPHLESGDPVSCPRLGGCAQGGIQGSRGRGIFVFDDLFKPQPDISPLAQRHVYDRLLFDTEYSFETYQKELQKTGFQILDAVDLSDHLKMSYWCLSIMTHNRGGDHAEHYEELCYSYEQTAQAVVNREIAWGLFLCQK